MFYGLSGTQKSIVTLISKFDPRKGQIQVKLGQIGSNFRIQSFLTKTYLSYPVLSQDLKNVICFHVRQLEMPKIAFQKSDVTVFILFSFARPKIKISL